ncbi:hypothetical protein AYO20_09806 [Fonsecaea nubica]|uniref:Mid2 domain-containing protein n=1 Tax=Fonsecaea nubica TaxID=856822 RepID=A0A178CDM1_9EURO|nr:hypothetical protein AYO20_09806 [Fonsecaea nubica]OAL27454.1 hypothetical protein AYO20_09806 [Fonsecaea nubica]
MAGITASVTAMERATARAIPVSPITSAPILTHQRGLIKRTGADTVEDNTCGWVNGDLKLHAVGCCADAATTDCAWVTSCVPYSMVNNGCDMACQGNYLNTVWFVPCLHASAATLSHSVNSPQRSVLDWICGRSDEAYPLCATATFGGPAGYTYLSCTDAIGTTDTMMLTYYGGNATVDNLPRYFSSYWYESTATSSTTSTSTSSPTDDTGINDTISWLSGHKTILIGAIAGFCGLLILLVVGGCCVVRNKRSRRGRYIPASQQMPPHEAYGMHYQGAAAYQRPPSYQSGYGYQQDFGQVYVAPNK